MDLGIQMGMVRAFTGQQHQLVAHDQLCRDEPLVVTQNRKDGGVRALELSGDHVRADRWKVPGEMAGEPGRVLVTVTTTVDAVDLALTGGGFLRLRNDHSWVPPRLYAHYT
jgi:hypothetical protein